MEKNWHILYTKPSTEKKVAAALEKKKIEYFLPLCYKQKKTIFFNKLIKEPLFSGYIFVYVNSGKLPTIQQESGAISFLYWKGKPAIVSSDDVHTIKEFVDQHSYIQVLPIGVNPIDGKSNINKTPLIVGDKPFSHFSPSFNVILPSLGYILSANHLEDVQHQSNVTYHWSEKVLN